MEAVGAATWGQRPQVKEFGVESEYMRPRCRPLRGARWLKTIGISMNWADMCLGPSLFRWRSPATGLEVKKMHEESRDRGMGKGGAVSTVKGIRGTWGCFLQMPSKFCKMRCSNQNLSGAPYQDRKTPRFCWRLFIVRAAGYAKKAEIPGEDSPLRFKIHFFERSVWFGIKIRFCGD